MIISINKSKAFESLGFGLHAGALLLVMVLPIAGWQQLGLGVLIGVSLWRQIRYGSAASACELDLALDGACVRTAQGKPQRYRVVQASTHPGFIRLTLRRAGERRRIQLVPRDSVKPEIYRSLRALIVQRRLPVMEGT